MEAEPSPSSASRRDRDFPPRSSREANRQRSQPAQPLGARRQRMPPPPPRFRQQELTTEPPHEARRSPPPNGSGRLDSPDHYRADGPSTRGRAPSAGNFRDAAGRPLDDSNDMRDDSDPRSYSRATVLAFLLLVGIAIAHAIASGFEGMHDSKRNQRTQRGSPEEGLDYSREGRETADSSSDANKVAYDNRSVNANAGGDPSEDAGGATTATTAATILSRSSQLSSLISHLDASDVIECYVVTRMAHLTNLAPAVGGGGGNNAGGNGNRNLQGESGDGSVRRMLDESMASSADAAAGESKAGDGGGAPDAPSPGGAATASIPSGPVLIRKSALAFRYRPRVARGPARPPADSPPSDAPPDGDGLSPDDRLERQKYFELTLEYGPRRAGAARTSESVPVVRFDAELAAAAGGGAAGPGRYVTWENEGSVYHSTRISGEWTEAYYMAAITGVVFEKAVRRAADYRRRRPRYQPVEVVSVPSGDLILRSSGSDDFVWDMLRDLAELYVDIDPILVPPRGKVQFYVADPEGTQGGEGDGGRRGEGEDDGEDPNPGAKRKRTPNPNVKQVKGPLEGLRAAVFYENFFNCANAIKTGDYSMYVPPPSSFPTSMPTVSAAPSTMPTASMAPSTAPSIGKGNETNGTFAEGGNSEDEGDEDDRGGEVDDDTRGAPDAEEYEDDRDDGEGDNEIPSGDLTAIEPVDDENGGENYTAEGTDGGQDPSNETDSFRRRHLPSRGGLPRNRRGLGGEGGNGTADAVLAPEGTGPADEAAEDEGGDEGGGDGGEDASSEDPDGAEGSGDDPAEAAIEDGSGDDPAEEAIEDGSGDDPAEAAIQAAKAAENAAAVVATNTSSAADTAAATNQAAIAAVKAKDASVAARSKSSAEALLSGDGELMTSILSNCFSDLKYGIRTQEEIQVDGNGPAEGDDDGESGAVEKRDLTFAYIYLDGNAFIRLNLTAPYWGTVSALQTVPPHKQGPDGKGDAVDWAIFMLILAGSLFGLLVLVHQMGYVIDKRLRFRNFFHPTMRESDWASEGDFDWGGEKSPLQQGGGFSHSELRMTVESIPTSMGGGDAPMPPPSNHDLPVSPSSVETDNSDERGFDLEMAERSPANHHNDRNSRSTQRSCSPIMKGFGDEGTPSKLPDSLRIKRDTPDLVERPSLKSMSKIARPTTSFGDEGTQSKQLYSLRINRDNPDLVERPSLKSTSKIVLPKMSPTIEEMECRKLKFNEGHNMAALPLSENGS